MPTPLYIDASSTICVINDEASTRRSAWIGRRIKVLQEAVNMGEIHCVKISERDNVADMMTKYLTFSVWSRHTHVLLNLPGKAPDHPRQPDG